MTTQLQWPAGTCAARVPLCRDTSLVKNKIADQDVIHVNRLMPRLGVGGLAHALGTTIKTLDRWVCGYGFGVKPSTAADLAERFTWLLRHEEDNRNRCACKICAPTNIERFQAQVSHLPYGHPNAMAVASPLACQGKTQREAICA